MKTPRILGVFALLSLPLSAQVSFTGNYSQNFDSIGTAGTAPPAAWSVWNGPGTSAGLWTNATGIVGGPSSTTGSVGQMTLSTAALTANNAPTATANNGYNAGTPGDTSNRLLASAPSSVGGAAFQLALTNNTAGELAGLLIGYDIRRFTAPSSANELPGYWLFFSTDNGNTWTNVPALNPALTGATVNVPNTAGLSNAPVTAFTFPSPVVAGAEIRLRWVDDNAAQSSPDQVTGLDNVSITALVNAAPTVSLTAPAEGATFDAPATITLTADAADSDGTVAKVEFFSGPTKLGEDTTAPYEFTWNNAISGAYALTAVATDNLSGFTTSSAVNISVTNTDNVSPTVSITTPADGATVPGGTVSLAAAAADTDGVVTLVEFFNGATKIGEDSAAPYTLDWFPVPGGSYTITVKATDNDAGTTVSAPVIFTANPITDLVFQEGVSGYTGTLETYVRSDSAALDIAYGGDPDLSIDGDDGSPGSAPNQGLIRFENIIGPGVLQIPGGSTITSATLSFTVFNPGSGLKVHRMLSNWEESSTWNSLTDGIQIDNVEAATAIIASVGADNGSANVPNGQLDLNITAAVQAWANGAVNHGLALIPFTAGTDGIDVHSSEGATVSQRPRLMVNFIPAPPNDAPTVTLTAPADGATYDAPATVSLSADADDTDGTIAKVEFFNGATKLGEDTTAPYELTLSNAITGNYVITAVATDNLFGTATSNAVGITVTNADNVAPAVTLTAPSDGTTILTDSVALAADASDTDGVISKVAFYHGSTLIGEDVTSPYGFNWTGVATGNYTLTAVATDNDNATTTSTAVNIAVAVPISNTLVARGASWKYLDNGSDQGTAWKEPAFNDSTWASGAAPLGYGDSHIITTVNSPAAPNRYITTYFRRNFNVTGAAAVQNLNLNILRDDGVVVYINGTEVARQNMPAGPVNYLTNAPTIIDGANETTYFPASAIPLPALVDGVNTIAVELHQRDGNSSDLGFDLELISLALPGEAPSVAVTSPLENASFTAPAAFTITADAEDTDGSIAKVEFFEGNTKLGEDTTEPYTYDWTVVPQGNYTLTAKATDNVGLVTTSTGVAISVGPPDTAFPTVAITAPANDANFLAPAAITLTADANDVDGTIARVEFFNGAIKLGEDTEEPYTYEWANVAVGDYTITAKATDNLTAATVSATVIVHVLPNQPPTISQTSPADLASVSAPAATLEVSLDDPEDQPLTVTFYGRPKSAPPGEDFTLVTIPDTQFYSENSGGNRFQYFTNQTNWIVSSKAALNTKFVAHMGDMTQSYNAVEAEFVRADEAMDIIENPLTTLLQHGLPWGGAPGNHDIGSGGNTSFWNQYFGLDRWAGRPYFGGGYSNKSDNNWQTFNAGGMDFIVINLAYNSSTSGNQAIMDWADALLKAHPNHRAIITSHWLIGTSFPPAQASWGGHGQAVYDNLKDNPNLFLMLCGHIHGEGRRSDNFEGRTVHTVLQDYQSRSNGGDSWLRYFTFSPANNAILAKTYRTASGVFETDADSEFTLAYNMASSAPWTELGTQILAAGSTTASMAFSGLVAGEEYEWHAAVTDGVTPVSTPVRGFTAVEPPPLPVVTIAATDAAAGEFGPDQTLEFTITRTGTTSGPLTVPLIASGSASSATDYSGFAGSVIIPAAQATVALPLTAIPDEESEGPETVTLTLAASSEFIAGSPASADAILADAPAQDFFFSNIADPSKRSATADADDDDSANIVEYFMGTQPDDSGSKGVLEIPSTGLNTFKIRFPRAKNRAAVTAALVWSSNLETWVGSGQSNGTHTVTFVETVVSDPEVDPETVETTATITGPGEAPKIFVRLGVR